jgi:hypothetical protein
MRRPDSSPRGLRQIRASPGCRRARSPPTRSPAPLALSARPPSSTPTERTRKTNTPTRIHNYHTPQLALPNTADSAQTPIGGVPEDEAERAATKIQAGFKGYKTRKELEGKLPSSSSGGGRQEAAAD